MTNTFRSRALVHPLFVDLGLTAATEFAVLAAGMLVVSLFGRKLGAVALGEYLLLRRVAAWTQAGTQPSIGTALPRYVAEAHAVETPGSEREAYFLVAVACGVGATVCLGIILNAARVFFARWLFGSAQMAGLVLPLVLLLVGWTSQNAVYGYYRGCLAMKRANALQLCNLVLIPVATVLALFRTGSVALIVSVTGASMLVCAGLFAAPIVSRLAMGGGPLGFRQRAADLLRYGIPRLPGALGHGAIFALGPMIAAHYLPMSQVSYLLLGVNLLMGVAASATPLGLILLSKVRMMLVQDRLAELRDRITYLQAAVLELYVFACLQLLVFGDVLVKVWVGPGFLKGIVIIRLVLLTIPFYLSFVSLRSVIDAASVTPHNIVNMFGSSAVFLALVVVAVKIAPPNLLLQSIAGAMVVATVILAWLTGRTVRRLLALKAVWTCSVPALLLGILLGAASLFLRWAQGFRTGLSQVLLIELAMGMLFLALLKQWHSPWLSFFWSTAFQRGSRLEAVAERH